jgi:hypothetical protein
MKHAALKRKFPELQTIDFKIKLPKQQYIAYEGTSIRALLYEVLEQDPAIPKEAISVIIDATQGFQEKPINIDHMNDSDRDIFERKATHCDEECSEETRDAKKAFALFWNANKLRRSLISNLCSILEVFPQLLVTQGLRNRRDEIAKVIEVRQENGKFTVFYDHQLDAHGRAKFIEEEIEPFIHEFCTSYIKSKMCKN